MLKELTTVQKAVLAGLAVLIVVSAGLVAAARSRPLPPGMVPPAPAAAPSAAALTVYVTGAVVRPGLYTLSRGDRVAQALEAAGGPTPDADAAGLNLARRLKDGERIRVAKKSPAPSASASEPGSTSPPVPPPVASSPDSAPSPAEPPAATYPVSLNAASAEQLAAVPGLTPRVAAEIVDYRTAHGAFRRVDELLLVEGMTPHILERIRPYVGL